MIKKKYLFIIFLSFIVLPYLIGCNEKKETITYNVSFYNGETLLKEERVNKGENAIPPLVDTKEGYVFEGWDQDYLNVQNDIKISAIIKKDSYSIIYNSMGGSNIAKIYYKMNQEIEFCPMPRKQGFKFAGWFLDLNDSKPYLFNNSVKITSDLTLYAKWKEIYNDMLNINQFKRCLVRKLYSLKTLMINHMLFSRMN